MMILAAARLERSVALCPGEVKYRIYLGLCYEELARRTPTERRKIWYARAQEAYLAGVAMNPLNAYYHGNLGRLYSLACEQGDDSAYPLSVDHYMQAISRAPTTRLFYENMLLLQARYADLDGAGLAMDRVEAADKPLASSLLLSAASTFFQWRGSKAPAWTAQKRAAAMPRVLDWASRARALDPDNADTTLALAVFEDEAGHRAEAQHWLKEALRLRPGFPDALAYAKSQSPEPLVRPGLQAQLRSTLPCRRRPGNPLAGFLHHLVLARVTACSHRPVRPRVGLGPLLQPVQRSCR